MLGDGVDAQAKYAKFIVDSVEKIYTSPVEQAFIVKDKLNLKAVQKLAEAVKPIIEAVNPKPK
ncbi:MAG: hypothetical protein NT023_02570 [Armatimonadetes bacterium]|nr:hypothetical protein [Armatimonadota bacterium]